MHCRPPKCQKRKRACACPNAWIEFLARTAADRKRQGLKPLPIRSMSLMYTRAKTKKEFGEKPIDQICKSDTNLLCKWNSERGKLSLPTQQKTKVKSSSSTHEGGLLPLYALDAENMNPPDVLKAPSPKDIWLPIVKQLLPNFRFLGCVEAALYCFEEQMTKAKILVRTIQKTAIMGSNPSSFLAFQMEARKRLMKGNVRVPRIHFYVKVKNGKDWTYLYGTDPAQGILKDLWKSFGMDKDLQRTVSKEFVRMQKALSKARMVHGDLHFENIVYFRNEKNRIDCLGLIDFEKTTFDIRNSQDVDSNTFMLLKIAFQKGFLQELMNDGFDLPIWFKEAVVQKKSLSQAFKLAEKLIDDFLLGGGVDPLQEPKTIIMPSNSSFYETVAESSL